MIHLIVKHRATYFGPNPFSSYPVVVADIQFDAGGGDDSPEVLRRAGQRMRDAYPEWFEDVPPSPESVVIFLGQTLARWALAVLNDVRGYVHESGATVMPGGVRLWLGFHQPRVSQSALELALKVLAQAANSTEFSRAQAQSALTLLWKSCRAHHPDFQARILMEAARSRDIPVLRFISDSKYWQYGWGNRSRVFFETMSNADGHLGGGLQNSKILSKSMFAEMGFPTPPHHLVRRTVELEKAVAAIGWPCVVKPIGSGGGKGVTAGIETMVDLAAAFRHARQYGSDAIMVEAFVPGDDHRLMVIDGRLVAAVRREASAITGDGDSTVAQLVETLNRTRSANLVKSRYLRPIATDEILIQHLARRGVQLTTVIEAGRRISLRSNSNISTGGVSADVTENVHPHVRKAAEMIANALGLAAAGIDYMTTDISQSWSHDGAFIEANSTPGLDPLLAAGLDPVAIGSLVLGPTPGRIPVQIVVVAKRDMEPALRFLQNSVMPEGFGWASSTRAVLEGLPLKVPQVAHWSAVEALLRNATLRNAYVVCTPQEIMRRGMPVDRAHRVALCDESGMKLPDHWLRVIVDCSETVERFSSWRDFENQAHMGA